MTNTLRETAGADGSPAGVIAEISANHLGSLPRAIKLVQKAKEAGAAFVKFQHYRPETISVRGDAAELTISGGTIWDGRQLWDLYQEAMTPWEWTAELDAVATEVGIPWFSTPFDETAVDFLEQFDVPLYKIASFEIIDLPLIRHVAKTRKPMIISTGMATRDEIDSAVGAAREAGASKITLLRTNSAYPAAPAEMDLMAIPFMRERWGVPVGLSDHTLGHTSAIVAAALGAQVFEKHFTLNRADGGPDGPFSAEPQELAAYVAALEEARNSLGSPRFGPSPNEEASIKLRPSLRAVASIARGDRITEQNVRSVRPAGGLPPESFELVEGRKAGVDIAIGSAVTLDLLES